MKANCLSLAIAVLLASPAVLQAAETAPVAAADAPADNNKKSEDATSLESITVTARRREETLQDVPIAVTATRG